MVIIEHPWGIFHAGVASVTVRSGAKDEDVHVEAGTFRHDMKNVFQALADSDASFNFSTSQIDLYNWIAPEARGRPS